jgi:hypothetical protein
LNIMNPQATVATLASAATLALLLAAGASLASDVATVKPVPAPAVRAASNDARTTKPNARAVDHLELESTAVTGNRELPKVMSIVPWKNAEPPGGPDRPMGSLIDELLAPLDRDEFRREITYYRDLTSQSALPVSASGAQQP